MRKKAEDKQTLAELNLAHRRSQAKCQFVQTSYIKPMKLFLFLPYTHVINILLTNRVLARILLVVVQ